MNFRTQLIKYLNHCYADDIQSFSSIMIDMLMSNCDFRLAYDEMRQETLEDIEEELGQKIRFSMDSIIGEQSMAIYAKVNEIYEAETKLKKQECIELMADVLCDDTLFEGLCISFLFDDDMLWRIMQDWGCQERYEQLMGDPVYRMRREYFNAVNNCGMAAVNLYGVIESSEMITVLEHYNSFDKKGKGYQRQEGSYRNTIMYTPQYLCEKVLEEVMDEIRTPVCITLDGVVAHQCFLNEYEKEAKKIIEYMKNGRSDQKLLEIFDGKDCAAYRQLRRSASAKPMYLPDREQFLKYADEDYYEITPEEEQLQAYLEQNYWKELEQAAARQERTVEECIEELMWEFHQETTDMGWEDIHRDVQSGMHYMMNKLQEYEVTFEDAQVVNRLAQKVMPAMNSIKLWYNHGYSPKEISELMSPKRSGAKKVYPNDPCPCGSGKKYKKCCGR